MSNLYMKPAKILEQLNLAMGVMLTIEDPIARTPITISYENLHSLLLIDVGNLVFEGQVVSNLYAEMARFQHAVEWAADRADARYLQWKAQQTDAFRAKRSAQPAPAAEPEAPAEGDDAGKKKGKKAPAAPKAPTVAEAEAAYRGHADYEKMSLEPKRLRAIAGLFEDLKWAFKMKSEQMRDASKTVGGYGATDRDGDVASGAEPGSREASMSERLDDYRSLALEASRASEEAGSTLAMQQLLQNHPPAPQTPPPQRAAKPLP